jgi:hypothetical protein
MAYCLWKGERLGLLDFGRRVRERRIERMATGIVYLSESQMVCLARDHGCESLEHQLLVSLVVLGRKT